MCHFRFVSGKCTFSHRQTANANTCRSLTTTICRRVVATQFLLLSAKLVYNATGGSTASDAVTVVHIFHFVAAVVVVAAAAVAAVALNPSQTQAFNMFLFVFYTYIYIRNIYAVDVCVHSRERHIISHLCSHMQCARLRRHAQNQHSAGAQCGSSIMISQLFSPTEGRRALAHLQFTIITHYIHAQSHACHSYAVRLRRMVGGILNVYS